MDKLSWAIKCTDVQLKTQGPLTKENEGNAKRAKYVP